MADVISLRRGSAAGASDSLVVTIEAVWESSFSCSVTLLRRRSLGLGVVLVVIREIRAQNAVWGEEGPGGLPVSRPSARTRRATCDSLSASVRRTGWSWRRWARRRVCRTGLPSIGRARGLGLLNGRGLVGELAADRDVGLRELIRRPGRIEARHTDGHGDEGEPGDDRSVRPPGEDRDQREVSRGAHRARRRPLEPSPVSTRQHVRDSLGYRKAYHVPTALPADRRPEQVQGPRLPAGAHVSYFVWWPGSETD